LALVARLKQTFQVTVILEVIQSFQPLHPQAAVAAVLVNLGLWVMVLLAVLAAAAVIKLLLVL